MKKILFVFAVLVSLAACSNTGASRQSEENLPQEENKVVTNATARFCSFSAPERSVHF